MIDRHITSQVLAALADTPIVVLTGARQTGKTTLVRTLASSAHPARYFSFDDAGVLAAAQADPAGFVAGLDGPVVLDEVQRVPQLFLALKASVDRDRRPGRFLLTGSANVLLLPRLAELLVGRMEVLSLWPLAQSEMAGVGASFVDQAFVDPPFSVSSGSLAAAARPYPAGWISRSPGSRQRGTPAGLVSVVYHHPAPARCA